MDKTAFRKALVAERDQLMADGEMSRADSKPVALDQQAVGRLSRMDAMQVQAMAAAADERRKLRLSRIESALKRLDSDVFGDCLRCGEEIEPKRLSFDATVTVCMSCQKS